MGTYNILHASLRCPRCGADVSTTVDCHFGSTAQMVDLQLGDRYPWVEGQPPQQGGRPASGTLAGEGYLECPQCHKDAFVRVLIRDGIVIGVEPDPARPGYLPD